MLVHDLCLTDDARGHADEGPAAADQHAPIPRYDDVDLRLRGLDGATARDS
jgi:hypothetical protein